MFRCMEKRTRSESLCLYCWFSQSINQTYQATASSLPHNPLSSSILASTPQETENTSVMPPTSTTFQVNSSPHRTGPQPEIPISTTSISSAMTREDSPAPTYNDAEWPHHNHHAQLPNAPGSAETQRPPPPSTPPKKPPGPWRKVELEDGSEELRREAVAGSAVCFGTARSRWEELASAFRSQPNKNYRWRPFADKREWEVAEFLVKSGMSQSKIDEFLDLQYVSA